MTITEYNCWVLLDQEGGKTILRSTWRYTDSSKSCWPYDQNCWCNPCARRTIPRCEVSQGGYCCHKNFLLLVMGPCQSGCKPLICPSKLMQSNHPWSSPLRYPFSISVVLVQRPRACLFCLAILSGMNLSYVCPSHQNSWGWNEIVH